MRFVLAINMDNAAFEDDAGDELRRILRHLSRDIIGDHPEVGDDGRVRDANGNTVGAWHVDGGE